MNNLMNQKFYQETISLLREADERMALIGKIKLLIESGQLPNRREVYTYLTRQIYASDDPQQKELIYSLIGQYANYEEEE